MYKKTFSRITFYSRWNHKFPPSDWCILGLSKWWFGSEEYCYKICLFGFEIHIWIDRKWINN